MRKDSDDGRGDHGAERAVALGALAEAFLELLLRGAVCGRRSRRGRTQEESSRSTPRSHARSTSQGRAASDLDNGACARPDELMCVEWLKRNPNAPRAAAPVAPVTEPRVESPAPAATQILGG